MTRRSFGAGLALTVALMFTAGGGATQNSSEIDYYSLFSFRYDRGQIRLTPAKNAASLVKEMRLEIYSFDGAKVFDSGAVVNQPIVWSLQDKSATAVSDGKYICSIQLTLDGGDSEAVFWQLSKSDQRVSFIDAVKLFMGSPANGAREFFKRLAASRPDDASAWICYGSTLCKEDVVIFAPPTPPASPSLLPPPPPPPPSEKENAGEKQVKTINRSANPNPNESDLKEAINAFQKALDLAADCKTKDRALNFLAATYSRLGAEEEEFEVILKRAESECATTKIKVSSYFSLGVKYWQCAYPLSTAYIDRDKFSYDAFHYRNFTNPADKWKFDDCLIKGFEFIDKALALDPECVEAIFYKGLLCREKQKSVENETERGQWADEAQKLAARGTDLQRKKEGR